MAVAERLSRAEEKVDQDRQLADAKAEHPIPPSVKKRMDRGRKRMRDGASERNEIMHFWRGNQYVYRSPKGYLLQQDTITDHTTGSGKPPHRMRTVRNMILDVVAREVSASTSRVPGFDVAPSSNDPEDWGASGLAVKAAHYGHDKWALRDIAVRTITLAVLPGEGFAWPYFDNTVGPYIRDDDGETLTGIGEIKVRVFNGNQVMWEPGQKFHESRWIGVESAMPLDDVRDLDGFLGGPLVANAESEDIGNTGPGRPTETDMVVVSHYLERPSPKKPQGRWLSMANGRLIAGIEDGTEKSYPCMNEKGEVIDEPVLHKLSYFIDPDNDRDFGMGRALIDPQRTYNDCVNKLLEWKNLAPIGQVFVTPGLMKRQRLTDAPGAIYEIPNPEQNVKFREIPDVPNAVFQILDQTLGDIARIAAQNDVPSQVESGKGILALLEADRARRADFLGQLAEWWSHLMRHCLYLMQRHYTDQDGRLLKLQGRFGPELISGFKGADLRGQADVRVLPGSIEPRTREANEQRVLAFADRGWISPEAAMSAIQGGSAEKLVEDYELDVRWAHNLIQKLKAGPEILFAGPSRQEGFFPDGEPKMVPGFMPRPFQNIPVIKAVLESWMKTLEFEQLDPPMQEAANQVYQGLEQIEADKAMKAQMQQAQMAGDLGMANAARPQEKAMPDRPAASPGGPQTPNQPPSQSPASRPPL